MQYKLLLVFASFLLAACGSTDDQDTSQDRPPVEQQPDNETPSPSEPDSDADDNSNDDIDITTLSSSIYQRSDACSADDVQVATTQATLLIGGSEANASGEMTATQWLIDQAIGGDYLVIRSDGIGSQADWVCGNFSSDINSSAELNLDSLTLANDARVEHVIRNAEILFFAGGNQSAYRSYWRNTKANDAINDHLRAGKPVAGTSAGMAILGQAYYAPENSGALSSEMLNNPFNSFSETIGNGDFLQHPQLESLITDTHLDRSHGSNDETRYGRLFGFLSRITNDIGLSARAIGAEEATFIAIDDNNRVNIFGVGNAYFLRPLTQPETIEEGEALIWNNSQQAVEVYTLNRNTENSFDLTTWSITGITPEYWYTSNGQSGFNCNGCSQNNL